MAGNISYTVARGLSSSSGSLASTYYQVGSGEQHIDVMLAAATVNQSQALSFSAPGSSSGDLVAIELVSTQPITLITNGTGSADVQTVSISGTPTGGTFALGFGGQVSSPIAYNAATSAVQTALRALSTIGASNITCTGGPLPGSSVVCTFSGSLNTGVMSLMSQNSGGLTGGSSPAVSVAHTTPGTPQDSISLAANVPLQWDVSCGLPCPFAGAVTVAYVSCANSCRLQGKVLTY